jgi:hypothetical protein
MGTLPFDTSGKIVLPATEELEEEDGQTAILTYVSGSLDDGTSYYAYIAVKPSKYMEFYSLTAERIPIENLLDYGVIVSEGFQEEPSPAVLREMRERYGFDDQWEEKLKLRLKQQRSKLCGTQDDDGSDQRTEAST